MYDFPYENEKRKIKTRESTLEKLVRASWGLRVDLLKKVNWVRTWNFYRFPSPSASSHSPLLNIWDSETWARATMTKGKFGNFRIEIWILCWVGWICEVFGKAQTGTCEAKIQVLHVFNQNSKFTVNKFRNSGGKCVHSSKVVQCCLVCCCLKLADSAGSPSALDCEHFQLEKLFIVFSFESGVVSFVWKVECCSWRKNY